MRPPPTNEMDLGLGCWPALANALLFVGIMLTLWHRIRM